MYIKGIVRQVGYLLELYRDGRSPEYKKDWGIFRFFMTFGKVASRRLGKIPYLNQCVPNTVEVYFVFQNTNRMWAWLCGNNLINVAENVTTDSLQTSLVTQNAFKVLRKYFHCHRATNCVWVYLMLQFHVLALQRVAAGKRLRIS
jgi:hypothetical protein